MYARSNPKFTPPAVSQWQARLHHFEPVSLTQINDAALLNRTDTKFVLTEMQLFDVLVTLRQDYQVLDIAGVRLNHYQTIYFDTADFTLYQRHHAGGRNRYKVPSRNYVDSRLSFKEPLMLTELTYLALEADFNLAVALLIVRFIYLMADTIWFLPPGTALMQTAQST